MPEFRDMLRRLADDSGGASGDLAEGALRRARSIGRRRFAAGALGAIAGLALAGMAAATLIIPDDPSPAPPVVNPTETESPSGEPSETPSPDDGDDPGAADGCGRPSEDWAGWGDSGATAELTSLPDDLYVEFHWNDTALTQVQRLVKNDFEWVFDEFALESETMGYSVAPDGNRYASMSACHMEIGTIDASVDPLTGLGIDGIYCKPSWAPDSNSVALTVAGPQSDERYLLDVATGEQTDLPDEVSCSPRWSADGEYLVSLDGTVAMRPDGSGRVELAGASVWNADETVSGVSAVSADLGRACLQVDTTEIASSGHVDPWRCDRLVDTATGEAVDLPIETERAQVVFPADGGMLLANRIGGDVDLVLYDAEMNVIDSGVFDAAGASRARLVGYFTE